MTDHEMITIELPCAPIMLSTFGSRLYGTHDDQSDVDMRGVYVPSADQILMNSQKDAISRNSKTDDQAKNGPKDFDITVIALRRYLQDLVRGEVNALDLLFATPLLQSGEILGHVGEEWEFIWSKRSHFLTNDCGALMGYCRRQVHKYGVKGSRVAAAEAVLDVFKSAATGFGSQAKASDGIDLWNEYVEGNEHCRIVRIKPPHEGGEALPHYECCGRKVPFTASLATAVDVFDRMVQNYGERARAARDNQGVDWKAMSHAKRAVEQAIELMATGHITFPRPNADELKAIKRGERPFQAVTDDLDRLLVDADEAKASSALPTKPEDDAITRMVMTMYGRSVMQTHAKTMMDMMAQMEAEDDDATPSGRPYLDS